MGRTFIDSDLEQDEALVSEEEETGASDELSRKRAETVDRVADATEEIERLKLQQGELEHARRELQELNRKQHLYETGKKAITAELVRQGVLLKKEEERLGRRLALVTAAQSDFTEMLEELRGICEDEWGEKGFEESLNHGLAVVEDIQKNFEQTIARLEGRRLEHFPRETGEPGGGQAAFFSTPNWLFWLKAGVGFAIPLTIAALLVSAAWLWWQRLGG